MYVLFIFSWEKTRLENAKLDSFFSTELKTKVKLRNDKSKYKFRNMIFVKSLFPSLLFIVVGIPLSTSKFCARILLTVTLMNGVVGI